MTDKPPVEQGYRIRGAFYPVATSRRLADSALIEQLTGLTVQEYTRRAIAQIEAAEEAEARGDDIRGFEFDEIVSLGALGLAVSRVHPGWSRTRVQDFVQSLENEEIEFVGGNSDDEEKEADERPPDSGETASKPGPSSPPPSSSESEATTDQDSSDSETLETSGASILPMSRAEQSA